jgi:hypothetical protein
VLQNDRFEGREFPAFRWRANWGQLDARRGTRNEGDNESEQGADPQEAPKGNDVPAINDVAGSILHEEDNRSEQGEGPPESGYTPEGIEQATIANSQRFARFLAHQQQAAIENAERQAVIDNVEGNEPQDKPGVKNEQASNAQANAMHDNASQADANTDHGRGHARHRYWGLKDNISEVSESRY